MKSWTYLWSFNIATATSLSCRSNLDAGLCGHSRSPPHNLAALQLVYWVLLSASTWVKHLNLKGTSCSCSSLQQNLPMLEFCSMSLPCVGLLTSILHARLSMNKAQESWSSLLRASLKGERVSALVFVVCLISTQAKKASYLTYLHLSWMPRLKIFACFLFSRRGSLCCSCDHQIVCTQLIAVSCLVLKA